MDYAIDNDPSVEAGIVVRVNGRVDYTAVASFTTVIDTVREIGPKVLRLDLKGVSAIDSVGFGLLIMLREALPAASIALSGASGSPARLLGLFDAKSLFEVTD